MYTLDHEADKGFVLLKVILTSMLSVHFVYDFGRLI